MRGRSPAMEQLCVERPWLRHRLAEVIAFVEGRGALSTGPIEPQESARISREGPLRHPALRPRGGEDFLHLRADQVEDLAQERGALVTTTRPRRLAELDRTACDGQVVACALHLSLCDGAANIESCGYFDDENVPPWDTWLAMIEGDASTGPLLLAYVPPAWIALVEAAIWVNPEECLLWF